MGSNRKKFPRNLKSNNLIIKIISKIDLKNNFYPLGHSRCEPRLTPRTVRTRREFRTLRLTHTHVAQVARTHAHMHATTYLLEHVPISCHSRICYSFLSPRKIRLACPSFTSENTHSFFCCCCKTPPQSP